MGWNYRKRVKIFPGVHLNFSKRGISTSIGPKGAKVTIGPKGTFLYTSIPRTGLYSRQKVSNNNPKSNENFNPEQKIQNQEVDILNEKDGFFAIKNNWGCCFRWFGLISIIYVIICLVQKVFGLFDKTNDDTFHGALLTVFLFMLIYHKLVLSFFFKLYSIVSLHVLNNKIKKTRNNITKGASPCDKDDTENVDKNAISAEGCQILRDTLKDLVK